MQERKIIIELTIEQVNVVMEGLAELPIKKGLATFSYIRESANGQLNQQQDMSEQHRVE